MTEKSAFAFRTISEVADQLGVPQHVLRFWETRFKQIKPMKLGGNRRYYRPEDVEIVHAIQHLLYAEGMTIKGAQKLLKDKGTKEVVRNWKRAAGIPDVRPEPSRVEFVPEPGTALAAEAGPGESAAAALPVNKPAAATGGDIKVSRHLVRALVNDLKALRDLINRLPD
ncbi:MAG TPA: MerR family transcriptional regulator [Sphingomonadales bacterium]|nr:MerR family transcriptional regulator [Sphingomonadales bacterium]